MESCPQCNNANIDDSSNCVHCGADMNTLTSQTPTPATPQHESGMFSNIGGKLKGLAKTVAVVAIILGILMAIIGLIMYIDNSSYLEYATAYGGTSKYRNFIENGNTAYTGLQLLQTGLVLGIGGLIGSWPLYGFGHLINTNEQILSTMQQIEAKTRPTD